MSREFLEFPDDVILEVAHSLGLHDAFNLALTCRRMRELSSHEHAYWANVLVNNTKPLPLSPYESVWHLDSTTLRGIAARMVAQENNLNQDEPRLRDWKTYDGFDGAYGFQENFVAIPGCPLLIIGEKAYYRQEDAKSIPGSGTPESTDSKTFDNSQVSTVLCTRISCFNYLEGTTLCSVEWPYRLYAMSQPYHGHGRCTLALQMNLSHDDATKPGMFTLEVRYHRLKANRWEVGMILERIPSVETDPLAGLPLLDMCIDENVVVYPIAMQGAGGENEFLKVVAHETTTGTTTEITTDIILAIAEDRGSQSSDYLLHLKNKELHIIREDASFTNLWRIPHQLLPYPGNSPEPRVKYLCMSENLGHSYEATQVALAPHWVAMNAFYSCSTSPNLISTLVYIRSSDSTNPDQFQYRQWSLSPDSSSQQRFVEDLSHDVRQPMASDGPQRADSLSSVLFITKRKRKPFKLRLACLNIGTSKPLARKVLEVPPELETYLGAIGHVHFDDGLATAVLLCGDLGRIIVLRYG
ncbi:hypothetical protein PM082_019473 [Marasmius tenuissimus]|nr:hypothetical protein PM082_019473 [Marasmius tenuissimus]